MGKLSLLKAALAKGHLALVILAVINSAIAIYYYLGIVREACFRDPTGQPAISLSVVTRTVCVALVVVILALGVAPSWLLGNISSSIASMNTPLAKPAAALAIADSSAVAPLGH